MLLLVIGQSMGFPISEFELQPVAVDNARMEKLESIVYELLNIIKHSDRLSVQLALCKT